MTAQNFQTADALSYTKNTLTSSTTTISENSGIKTQKSIIATEPL